MKAERLSCARPYASALFDAAQASQAIDLWHAYLKVLAQILSHRKIELALHDPCTSPEQVIAWIKKLADETVAGSEALGASADNLLRLLLQNHRLVLLPQIYTLFCQLQDEAAGLVHVTLTSACPVSADLQQIFQTQLSKRLGKKVDLTLQIDQDILGGAIIRAGDLVIDGSVRGKLLRLAYQMQH